MATLTLAEVQNIVYEALNASKSVAYGAFDGNPGYKIASIRDAIFNADYKVAQTIAKTPGHPRRSTPFLETISTGGEWTSLMESDSKAEGVMIDGKAGRTAPATKIQQWLSNISYYGGADVVNGYYDIVNNQVFFSGDELTYIHYRVPDLASNAENLNSPKPYRSTVVRLALAELLLKDPDQISVASSLANAGRDDLMQIESGKIVVPEFTMIQQAR